ncbi:MAG: carboxypeptidase-like regulatory domain-containing protein, partial [Bacteroidota bacterium]|nr:carboxypeptidase-like regulatory domain-containing protein [Bacteroidota bacterium]
MTYKKIQNHFTMPRIYLLGVLLTFCTGNLFGQGSISGVVVDENDEPTYGAAVKIIELERSALTDLDGVFFFDDIPEGRYLISIESLGYDKIVQSVNVGPDAAVVMGRISLMENIELTEEIVVVGYGVSKKRDIV